MTHNPVGENKEKINVGVTRSRIFPRRIDACSVFRTARGLRLFFKLCVNTLRWVKLRDDVSDLIVGTCALRKFGQKVLFACMRSRSVKTAVDE